MNGCKETLYESQMPGEENVESSHARYKCYHEQRRLPRLWYMIWIVQYDESLYESGADVGIRGYESLPG